MKSNKPETNNAEIVETHEQWALEKQTEGLDPEVVKASEDLKEEALKEAAEA